MKRAPHILFGTSALTFFAFLTLVVPRPVSAASTRATVAVRAGSLRLSTGVERITRAADGSLTVRIPFTVVDARGAGTGWTVTATAPPRASMRLAADSLRRLSVWAVGLPRLAAPPVMLGATPRPLIVAVPGQSGMGGFAGALTFTLPASTAADAHAVTLRVGGNYRAVMT